MKIFLNQEFAFVVIFVGIFQIAMVLLSLQGNGCHYPVYPVLIHHIHPVHLVLGIAVMVITLHIHREYQAQVLRLIQPCLSAVVS